MTQNKKTRLIVKKGKENIVIRLEEIAFIYRDENVVFVVDKNERRYLADGSITSIEAALDPNVFFRVNRKHLVNIHYIRSYKPLDKVKLSIALSLSAHPDIVVSQEMAPVFKKWVHEES